MVLPGNEIEVESYKDIFDESYQETKMRQQFVIDRICDDLERIGYSVQPIIIPACAVGAPHRRDRIWFIANANGERCDNWDNYWQERHFYLDKKRYAKKNKSEWAKRKYWFSKDCEIFANSTSEGLQRKMSQNAIMPAEPFRNFPTQSPVCCGDDGLSARLSGITLSKHRSESIKAYGNTMVPQVVYQLCNIIDKLTL